MCAQVCESILITYPLIIERRVKTPVIITIGVIIRRYRSLFSILVALFVIMRLVLRNKDSDNIFS